MSSIIIEPLEQSTIDILLKNIFKSKLFNDITLMNSILDYNNDINFLDNASFSNSLKSLLSEFYFRTTGLKNISDYYLYINLKKLSYNISNELIEYNSVNYIKIIPIAITFALVDEGHANVVIVDDMRQTIEFFEPHGLTYNNTIYNGINLNDLIPKIIHDIYPNSSTYTFINVSSQCKKGLQSKESSITKKGYCLAWSLLFIKLKLDNLALNGVEIINYLDEIDISTLHVYLNKFINYLQLLNNISNDLREQAVVEKSFYNMLDNDIKRKQYIYIINIIKKYVNLLDFQDKEDDSDKNILYFKKQNVLINNIYNYSKYFNVHKLFKQILSESFNRKNTEPSLRKKLLSKRRD
jgi:hypothetical protein